MDDEETQEGGIIIVMNLQGACLCFPGDNIEPERSLTVGDLEVNSNYSFLVPESERAS